MVKEENITKNNTVEVHGVVENIVFSSPDGFKVIRLSSAVSDTLVTAVGTMPLLNVGEQIKITGSWIKHPTFGVQLKVDQYMTQLPATCIGIQKYLGSGLVKGIGAQLAKRLVEYFKEDTIRTIEEQPHRLKEVHGISDNKIQNIVNAWKLHKDINTIMIFLQGHGISPTFAYKIYDKYGKDSIEMVSTNPYRLSKDIKGVGFHTADKVASSIGIQRNSPYRVEAAILHTLSNCIDDGNSCIPTKELVESTIEVLVSSGKELSQDDCNKECFHEIIVKCLKSLENTSYVKHIRTHSANNETNDTYTLSSMYRMEQYIAKRIKELATNDVPPSQHKDSFLNNLVHKTGLSDHIFRDYLPKLVGIASFADKQIEAIKATLQKKILVITGGPGTGKTTILKSIVLLFKKASKSTLLCAPTGRASKRLSEMTGCEAKTIHRLLEYDGIEKFNRNETKPLECDLLIIDEISMVDIPLMYHLLKATKNSTTLVMVGDSDQLPSVGPGNILKDIISSNIVPTIRLNEVFRQACNSLIVTNAHKVNRGMMPDLHYSPYKLQDFYFIAMDEPEVIVNKIIELCTVSIPHKFAMNPLTDIQILSAMYKGDLGVLNLNTIIQSKLNPTPKVILDRRNGTKFATGDRVIQLSNNYEKGIFNGDIGIITHIGHSDKQMNVNFDGTIVSYDFTELDQLSLAYCITIHKSQGSEYPAVIVPLHTQHYIMLQRNLLYTAITRGKKLVILIGSERAIELAISNNKSQTRWTYLEHLLRGNVATQKATIASRAQTKKKVKRTEKVLF